MMKLLTLSFMFLFCHDVPAVKHSLTLFFTATSGVPNFPEFVVVVLVDEVQVGYCDSNINKPKASVDWITQCTADDPQHVEFYTLECLVHQQFFKATLESLRQRYNHSEGVHIFQRVNGCEWDDETGDIHGFNQYGYEGEDFLALDLNTLTWTAPNSQAFFIKQRWDAEKVRLQFNKHYLTQECPRSLKRYLDCRKRFMQRAVLPSVSLLQTPSSPVTCIATGFYPDKVMMLWRKDGVALQENVVQGEILPNHDGTFQMSVSLDVSSIKSEDWGRYDCVFQLSGAEDIIITRLDEAVIKTNKPKAGNTIYKAVLTGSVIGGAMILSLIGCIVRVIRRGKEHDFTPAESREENEEDQNGD